MTREELNLKLNLSNDIHPIEQHSSSLQLRNYIELRLISDSLQSISESMKLLNNQLQSEDENGDTEYLVDSIVNLRNAFIKK
jgi:hypothetical protein